MKAKLFILLLMLILLLSCQNDKQGVIIAKWHEPESNSKIVVPIDNGGSIIFANYVIYDYEDWCLKIKTADNETAQVYYIDSQSYDTLEIGDNIALIELLNKDINNKKIKIE